MATSDEKAAAQKKAKACMAEVRAVLDRHGCDIVTMVATKRMRDDPGTILVESEWAVAAKAV